MAMLRLILISPLISNPLSISAQEYNQLSIDAEKLVLDREKNTAIFTGNVLICFQGMKLATQKAIFTFEGAKGRKIKIITFPEKLQALIIEKERNSVILADHAVYTMLNQELVLTGHVMIEDKGEIVITDHMLYYGKIKNIVLESE